MSEMKGTEPIKMQWAAPIVRAPKKDGPLKFRVEFRKLNTVTGRPTQYQERTSVLTHSETH